MQSRHIHGQGLCENKNHIKITYLEKKNRINIRRHKTTILVVYIFTITSHVSCQPCHQIKILSFDWYLVISEARLTVKNSKFLLFAGYFRKYDNHYFTKRRDNCPGETHRWVFKKHNIRSGCTVKESVFLSSSNIEMNRK